MGTPMERSKIGDITRGPRRRVNEAGDKWFLRALEETLQQVQGERSEK